MNGHGEKYLMQLAPDMQSVNAELFGRKIELKIGESWIAIQNFSNFTPADMRDIRNDVEKNDPAIDLLTEIPHPKTKEIIQYPIVGSTDFFFPREI